MEPLAIRAFTLTSALGRGVGPALAALRAGRGGLRPCDFEDVSLKTWIGRIDGLEEMPLNGAFADYDCRNNRLAALGLAQDGFAEAVAEARVRHGAERIGVFIGTSTSGVLQAELAYRERDPESGELPAGFRYPHTLNAMSVTRFVRGRLGLGGPAMSMSTACSSSAKVFATAYRHIALGNCDAAVVGGVDSLCLSTLYGFHSLGLVSTERCRPWDARRTGMSIGESAGFALLERPAPGERGTPALLGYGESSDAFHMSAPHPEGAGAAAAMRRALLSAGIGAHDIDYVNLHGTATPANDETEDRAVVAVLGDATPCSSTKGWTGHTLGAAGIIEALFAMLSVTEGFIPGTLNTSEPDARLSARIVLEGRDAEVRRALSNSFGFGGSNCSLVLGTLP
ncbi:MAG: beta-ketoacyl-[acyl-carrier-protein] synthase family protein [Gammaproteobacteria bacterium]|nr:beta-ketoacyl-[acyl-carrier-protein] synthase family protein [Gammaproteobacteria bacterium]